MAAPHHGAVAENVAAQHSLATMLRIRVHEHGQHERRPCHLERDVGHQQVAADRGDRRRRAALALPLDDRLDRRVVARERRPRRSRIHQHLRLDAVDRDGDHAMVLLEQVFRQALVVLELPQRSGRLRSYALQRRLFRLVAELGAPEIDHERVPRPDQLLRSEDPDPAQVVGIDDEVELPGFRLPVELHQHSGQPSQIGDRSGRVPVSVGERRRPGGHPARADEAFRKRVLRRAGIHEEEDGLARDPGADECGVGSLRLLDLQPRRMQRWRSVRAGAGEDRSAAAGNPQ